MPKKLISSPKHGDITIDSPPDGGRRPDSPAPVPATITTSDPWVNIPIPVSLGGTTVKDGKS